MKLPFQPPSLSRRFSPIFRAFFVVISAITLIHLLFKPSASRRLVHVSDVQTSSAPNVVDSIPPAGQEPVNTPTQPSRHQELVSSGEERKQDETSKVETPRLVKREDPPEEGQQVPEQGQQALEQGQKSPEKGQQDPPQEVQQDPQHVEDKLPNVSEDQVKDEQPEKPKKPSDPFDPTVIHDDELQRTFPRNRRVVSREKLTKMTNKDSKVPRIHFVGPLKGKTDLEIPEFPLLKDLPFVNATADIEEKTGDHRNAITEALDAQYSYSNRIRDAMQDILTKYPHMEYARANACIFILCRNDDLGSVLQSLSTFEFAFNSIYHYPYVLINEEPFTEEFKQRVQSMTQSKVEFGLIPEEHWSLPDDIDPVLYQERLDFNKQQYLYGGSKSYRFMCRYNSRFFYKHPLLRKYRYYWRVEPSIYYRCLIRYDPFLFMALSKKTYGFTIVGGEFMKTVEDMWRYTVDFMKDEQLPLSPLLRHAFYDAENNDYNGVHFWSNFEITDLEFYRSEIYERYMQYLDRSKGFFYHRYGDAPIHSIAAAMLLPAHEIHHFSDISYYHDDAGTCPMTKNETFAEFKNICWCKRDRNWIENAWWPKEFITLISALNRFSFKDDEWL